MPLLHDTAIPCISQLGLLVLIKRDASARTHQKWNPIGFCPQMDRNFSFLKITYNCFHIIFLTCKITGNMRALEAYMDM